MLLPCEEMVKQILPALKSGIAKQLHDKYGYSQVQIASELGITQAAVSKYLNSDKKESRDVVKAAETLARKLAVEKVGKREFVQAICDCCAMNDDCSMRVKVL